ncbi:MAG: Rrf2 family transcriptional regulator [Ignavibacteriales bacterium]
MKFSAQEEYGIRCLIRIGKYYDLGKSPTIPQISKEENISEHNAAKLLRVLRLGGFLESERGHMGGYSLSLPPEKIFITDVLNVLGGRLYSDEFCNNHSGISTICTNSIDCSVRSLWQIIQDAVDKILSNLTLRDLLGKEEDLFTKLNRILDEITPATKQNSCG